MTDDVEPNSSFLAAGPVVAFLVIAFAWSWGVWAAGAFLGYGGALALIAPVAWGPLVGAAVVTYACGEDLAAWVRQVNPDPRVGPRWYAVAVVVPFLLIQTEAIVAWAFGSQLTFVSPGDFVSEFLFVLFLAGAIEEFGWRGFLQPRLQERWSALAAALAVGVAWAAWHVPIVAGGGAGYDGGEWVGFFVFLPLFSILMAWLYNSTRGGLLFVMLFHATLNTLPVFEADAYVAGGALQLVPLLAIPTVVVIWHYPRNRKYLAANGPERRVSRG